jgi:hypothetical protein
MSKKIRVIGIILVAALWLGLVGFAWFGGTTEESESERRKLAQFPGITTETLLNGKFMTAFEDYTLDQFPLRDDFRTLKSLFSFYVLQHKDNNGIYLQDGYAAKLEYPLDEDSVNHGMDVVNQIYEKYLKESGSTVFAAVIPDKGYYLAEANGYPAMDYEKMFSLVKERMPFATHIDLTDSLAVEDYYFTDTHWRQEKLLPVAEKLSSVLGVTAPKAEDFRVTQVERPFYGVYCGQAALPLDAETMYLMESDLLAQCQVFDHEKNQYMAVYDPAMLESKDLYDLYLAGSKPLLTIENPNATTDRELVIFRDSFGSSIAPLLVQDYKTVTLVDLRLLNSTALGSFMDFHGQDVLFLYSTLVLNSDTQRMR